MTDPHDEELDALLRAVRDGGREHRRRQRHRFLAGVLLLAAGGSLVWAAIAFTPWLLLAAGWSFRSAFACWAELTE